MDEIVVSNKCMVSVTSIKSQEEIMILKKGYSRNTLQSVSFRLIAMVDLIRTEEQE